MTDQPTPSDLASALEISRTFAWQVLRGKRGLSDAKTAKAWRERGWKLGKLKDATDADAKAFARVADGFQ